MFQEGIVDTSLEAALSLPLPLLPTLSKLQVVASSGTSGLCFLSSLHPSISQACSIPAYLAGALPRPRAHTDLAAQKLICSSIPPHGTAALSFWSVHFILEFVS